MRPIDNQFIADRLHEAADLLEQQAANPFRVNAYRRAADTVASLERLLSRLLDEGRLEALMALPGIGESLASAIAQMVRTGRWPQLERLRGSVSPEELFRSIPGVGAALARRLHESLDVDTLEELEIAAHDGRLEPIPGVGPRHTAMLRAALATMLGRRRPPARSKETSPSVTCCSISTGNTANRRAPESSRKLRHAGSTHRAKRGSQSSTSSATDGASQPFARTRRALTSCAGLWIGSSISAGTIAPRGSARW
jgi:DNA polymerase/3'-5' exonuclease PolX